MWSKIYDKKIAENRYRYGRTDLADCKQGSPRFRSGERNFTPVKEMLLQAEVYVCEDEESNEIRGFIGLEEEYIAGVFVRKEIRSKGTGKALLDYVKEIKRELTLHVYVKNERAVRFYQREGFQILKKMTDDATGEEEYLMDWKRNHTPMTM